MTMSDDNFSVELDNDYRDETENEFDNELEAVYYDAKAKKGTDPDAALEGFSAVVLLEDEEKGQWGFKALKQRMKIQLARDNRQDVMSVFEQLVAYGKSAVKRSDFERSMHHILEHVWTSSTLDADFVEEFSYKALKALKEFSYEMTWHNMMIKSGKRYLERGKYAECQKIIEELKNYCLNTVHDDDLKKGAELERYALEIQLQTVLKNTSLLPALYEQALRVQPAIPRPAAMGVIRECGGMMHLRQWDYDIAYSDFFEALSHYNDTGNRERCIVCLKHLGVVSMLMSSTINPYDCQEARAYQNEEEVAALAELVRAYQVHNLGEFNKILETRGQFLVEDDFIRPYITVLQQHFGTEELLPCERFLLEYMNTELQSPDVELERLLQKVYILDGDLSGLREKARILRIQHAFESYGVIHKAEQDTFFVRVHFDPVWSFGGSQNAAERKYQLRFPFADSDDYADICCALDESADGVGSPESVWELPFSSDTFKEQLRWYLSFIVRRILALHWTPPVRVAAALPWLSSSAPATFGSSLPATFGSLAPPAPVAQAAEWPRPNILPPLAPGVQAAAFSFNFSSHVPRAQAAGFSSNLSPPAPVAQAAELPSWLNNLSSAVRDAPAANLQGPSTDRSVHDVNLSWPDADAEKK